MRITRSRVLLMLLSLTMAAHAIPSQFRAAIHSVPTYAIAHYQLAMALAQKGQKDESGSEFQKASQLDSHLVAPH